MCSLRSAFLHVRTTYNGIGSFLNLDTIIDLKGHCCHAADYFTQPRPLSSVGERLCDSGPVDRKKCTLTESCRTSCHHSAAPVAP